MKKVIFIYILSLITFVIHSDSRMDKFDSNNDGQVSSQEIIEQGCSLNLSLFNYADKDNNGFLNVRELRKGRYTALRGC
tara:strand:+ start:77 stop:313 length:237 start_codon:yes stop_codon:yes gene_type:complete